MHLLLIVTTCFANITGSVVDVKIWESIRLGAVTHFEGIEEFYYGRRQEQCKYRGNAFLKKGKEEGFLLPSTTRKTPRQNSVE